MENKFESIIERLNDLKKLELKIIEKDDEYVDIMYRYGCVDTVDAAIDIVKEYADGRHEG